MWKLFSNKKIEKSNIVEPVKIPGIKTYEGNLTITNDNKNFYKDLELIEGDLTISENVRFDALSLKIVTKYIILKQHGYLSAPSLENTKQIHLYGYSTIKTPILKDKTGLVTNNTNYPYGFNAKKLTPIINKNIKSNIFLGNVKVENIYKIKQLRNGYNYDDDDTEFINYCGFIQKYDNIEIVYGNIYIHADGYINLKNIKTVKGKIILERNAILTGLNLETVTDGIEIFNPKACNNISLPKYTGEITINEKQLEKMEKAKIYKGDLKVESSNQNDYEYLEIVEGDLIISKGIVFSPSSLVTVTENIYIKENSTLIASSLKNTLGVTMNINSVVFSPILENKEGFYLNEFKQEFNPKLKEKINPKINLGDLEISAKNQDEYEDLQVIYGDLKITKDTSFSSDKLVRVTGNVIIMEGGNLSAPNLIDVDGHFTVCDLEVFKTLEVSKFKGEITLKKNIIT